MNSYIQKALLFGSLNIHKYKLEKSMKQLIKFLLGTVLVLGISACGPSQEELLKEKQKKEKIRLAKLQELKEIDLQKKTEAQKYLSVQNDNIKIWEKIDYMDKYLNKNIYETKNEYKERINVLHKKVFNKKLIFDYSTDYVIYDAEEKKLYLAIESSNNFYKLCTAYSKQSVQFPGALIREKYVNGFLYKNIRTIRANVPCTNVNEKDIVNIRGKKFSAILIKENCSPIEAKKIQKNWKIRFITDITYLRKRNYGIASYVDYQVKANLIIIYDKYTNKIYKVFY